MNPYDSTLFDPPAPVARVTLRDPVSKRAAEGVPMLLDTGADVTLVPTAVVKALDVREAESFQLAAFDGRTSFAASVRLELLLAGRTFRGRFLLVESTWGVLGRNVLNSLPLSLDGPSLTWHVPGSRS